MTASTMNAVLGHLRRAALLLEGGGLTDGQLLDCFLSRRDEAAFESLVYRHGPMVLGVCRRILANEADAEDAFQATFLVLARKAASIVPRDLVGNWLYGVALRTAVKGRTATARRRVMERQVKAMPEHPKEAEDVWHDLQPLLDHELQRLPGKYRVPVVLCDLEGQGRTEVARHLGIPEGTLSSRLATARKMLARRLARRGLALSAGSLALVFAQQAASACVPASLVGPTVAAATRFVAREATAGVISAQVAVLAEEVLQSMLLARLKVVTALVLALGVFATGAGIVACQTPTAEREDGKSYLEQRVDALPAAGLHQADQKEGRNNDKEAPPNTPEDGRQNQTESQKNQKDDDDDDDDDDQKYTGIVKAMDVSRNTLTLTVRRKGKETNQTFGLTRTVQVQVAGKAAHLSDVKPGMSVVLKLSGDKKLVVAIKTKGQQKGPASSKNRGDD